MSCSPVWGVRFSAVEPVSPDFRDVQPDGDGLLPVVGIAQPGGDVPGGVVEKSAGGVEVVPDGFGFGQRVGGQKPFPDVGGQVPVEVFAVFARPAVQVSMSISDGRTIRFR